MRKHPDPSFCTVHYVPLWSFVDWTGQWKSLYLPLPLKNLTGASVTLTQACLSLGCQTISLTLYLLLPLKICFFELAHIFDVFPWYLHTRRYLTQENLISTDHVVFSKCQKHCITFKPGRFPLSRLQRTLLLRQNGRQWVGYGFLLYIAVALHNMSTMKSK